MAIPMNSSGFRKQCAWLAIGTILLSGCTSPKSLPASGATPTLLQASPASPISSPQPAHLIPVPPGLVLVQDCEGSTRPCPNSIWLSNAGGRYTQWPFLGTGLTLAHHSPAAAYEHDGDLWLLDLRSGESRNLTSTTDCYEHDVTWSPDDTRLAFLGCGSDLPDDVYTLDLSSGKRANRSNTPDRFELCFSANFSPSSSCRLGWWPQQPDWIFAGSGKPEQPPAGAVLQGHCHTFGVECYAFPTRISTDGKNYQILDPLNGLENLPALSPDGKLLAFDGGIIYDLETGQKETIHPAEYGLPVEASNEAGDPQLVSPLWSPDGKQIAWIGHVNERGDNGLYVFDLSAHHGQILLTYSPYYVTLMLPAWRRWSAPGIAWSPDSRWIAFSDSEMAEQEYAFLWVFSRDGTTRIKFNEGDLNTGPGIWSQDSRYLIFLRRHFAYTGLPQTVQMIEVDGWQVSQLNASVDSYPIAWSPP